MAGLKSIALQCRIRAHGIVLRAPKLANLLSAHRWPRQYHMGFVCIAEALCSEADLEQSNWVLWVQPTLLSLVNKPVAAFVGHDKTSKTFVTTHLRT